LACPGKPGYLSIALDLKAMLSPFNSVLSAVNRQLIANDGFKDRATTETIYTLQKE
jgi:hypothetical protein